MDDEYNGGDSESVTAQIKEAWGCVPSLSFGEFLNVALDGYDPRSLKPDEIEELLNDFILQNQ